MKTFIIKYKSHDGKVYTEKVKTWHQSHVELHTKHSVKGIYWIKIT